MDSKFWDIFSTGPILDNLGNYLRIGDIVNLSRTCKALSGMYHEVLPQQWDVENLLSRFVYKPREFREQFGLAKALITGDFALEFFERPCWETKTLDIVVPDSLGVERLRDYLETFHDYNFILPKESLYGWTSWKHIARIVILRRFVNYQQQEIRLSETWGHACPVESILEGALTTAAVNFISWRKAYSLFPLSTFIDKKPYMLRPSRNELPLADQEYLDRGFVLEVMQPALRLKKTHPMQRLRKPGDKFCWRITLNTRDMTNPLLFDTVPEEEYIYLTEERTLHNENTDANLSDPTSLDGRGLVMTYRYEAKYMRYNGFFT